MFLGPVMGQTMACQVEDCHTITWDVLSHENRIFRGMPASDEEFRAVTPEAPRWPDARPLQCFNKRLGRRSDNASTAWRRLIKSSSVKGIRETGARGCYWTSNLWGLRRRRPSVKLPRWSLGLLRPRLTSIRPPAGTVKQTPPPPLRIRSHPQRTGCLENAEVKPVLKPFGTDTRERTVGKKRNSFIRKCDQVSPI